MISIQNVSKRFDGTTVVKDINLTVKEGEIVGLLGPNGAGKTTTLRMVAGVLPPSGGTVRINDRDIATDPGIKTNIGYLPENNPLHDELTVEEFLMYWAGIKQIPAGSLKESVDFVVDRCGIAEVFYRPISELSKGYRQRVGLSQAILTKPGILLLDEPTEGLDPNQRQDIATLIRDLGRDRTVIISSHVLPELARIAGRMIIIHKGAVVADETPENLRKMGTGSKITEAEITGTGVISKLKAIRDVTGVKEIRKNYFEIETSRKKDIRGEIFKLAVKHKWTLLTLVAKEQAIEDVFGQLTAE